MASLLCVYERLQRRSIPGEQGGLLKCPNESCESERYEFAMALVRIRELLEPIATGRIKRGKRASQYDLEVGTRKTTMKDASAIARLAQERINIAANKYSP